MLAPPHRARLSIWVDALVALFAFWGIGSVFDMPARSGYGATLLTQSNVVIALVVTGVTLVACVVIGSVITARAHRGDAGLLSAAIGLAALSLRSGPTRDVLLAATGRDVFLTLALELLTLGAMLLISLLVLRALRPWIPMAEPARGLEASLAAGLGAFGTHVFGVALIVGLLAQTDQKAQVLVAVALGSYLASLLAHSLFPIRNSVWLWISPIVVGSIGYVLAWRMADGWDIGQVGGHFGAALARPLPLDWASAGPAGAIVGYWTSCRWVAARDASEEPHTGVSTSD